MSDEIIMEDVLKLLNHINTERYLSITELMEATKRSEKTVRYRLKALKAVLEGHGARIVYKKGAGYRLAIDDGPAYMAWQKNCLKKLDGGIPSGTDSRVNYILSLLLNRKEYIKRARLAEFLCISEKTVSADIGRAEQILMQYGLKLDRKPSYGMKVVGDEFKKRQCMMNHLIIMNTSDFFMGPGEKRDMEEIGKVLQEILEESNMPIAELPFQNMVCYLYVMSHRIKHGFQVERDVKEEWKKDTVLYSVSKMVLERMVLCGLLLTYAEGEIYFTSLFLWGNRFIEIDKENKTNYVIPAYIYSTASKMLERVNANLGIDMGDDLNLQLCLLHHLSSLDVRMKYNILIKNEHQGEIQEKYPFAWLVAKEAVSALEEIYQKPVSEAECAYFALLFAMKLERGKETRKKLRVLLICATGKIGSQFLKYRLEEEFAKDIEAVDMKSIYEQDGVDFSAYDYILTTVPIDKALPVPVVLVRDFFNQEELIKVQNGLHSVREYEEVQKYLKKELFFENVPVEGGNDAREGVIRWMCDKIKEVEEMPEDFYAQVMERERLGGTDFGNLAAAPHPLKGGWKKNLICVGVLERPVLWHRNEVQLVVLANMWDTASTETQKVLDMTARFLMDSGAVEAVIKERTFGSLLVRMAEMALSARGFMANMVNNDISSVCPKETKP